MGRSYDEIVAEITDLIATLDQEISRQLSVIMHHEKFKALESDWKSLNDVVFTEYPAGRIKVRILDISWQEISNDLNLSYDIRRTTLFHKIYSRELNTAGGLPFGLIGVSHRISLDGNTNIYRDDLNDFDDIYTAQLLGELGEACLCPIVVGIDEFFFGDNPEAILQDQQKLMRIIDSDDFRPWQNLRHNPSSRFLNIVLPDYLVREPYVYYKSSFIFNESCDSSFTGLWGNAIYLLLINVIREFARVSWFGFLRAYDETAKSGAIVVLPQNRRVIPKLSLCVEEDNTWADMGLTVLTNIYLTGYYGFFSNSMVIKSETERDRIVNMLQTTLMACRFSHYLKVLLRDKIGSYDTADECRDFLSGWISKYVMNTSFSDDSVVARYPLKSFEITVKERPDDSTIYDCDLKIEPQYQYDISTASILLTTTVRSHKGGGNS